MLSALIFHLNVLGVIMKAYIHPVGPSLTCWDGLILSSEVPLAL